MVMDTSAMGSVKEGVLRWHGERDQPGGGVEGAVNREDGGGLEAGRGGGSGDGAGASSAVMVGALVSRGGLGRWRPPSSPSEEGDKVFSRRRRGWQRRRDDGEARGDVRRCEERVAGEGGLCASRERAAAWRRLVRQSGRAADGHAIPCAGSGRRAPAGCSSARRPSIRLETSARMRIAWRLCGGGGKATSPILSPVPGVEEECHRVMVDAKKQLRCDEKDDVDNSWLQHGTADEMYPGLADI